MSHSEYSSPAGLLRSGRHDTVSNATLKKQTQSGADFSECGRYRYKLWRTWDDVRPVVMFIMLNPSTADATADDPTIRRCIGFAHDWGYGGVRVGNLFAWRTPYPQRVAVCSRTHRARQRQRPVRTGRGRRAGGCGVGRTWDVACASADRPPTVHPSSPRARCHEVR